MWANANVMVAPVPNRWRAVLNVTKFGSRPLLDCCAVTLPIGEHKTWKTQSEFRHLVKFRYGATAAKNVYIVYQPE